MQGSSSSDQVSAPPSNRCLGFGILLTQVMMMIAYGLLGNFFQETATDLVVIEKFAQSTLLALFTVVGFGLLLSSYRQAVWLGMLTSLLTVAIGIQAGPLMQKLWFGVFFTGFTQSPATSSVAAQIQDFWSRHIHTQIELNFVGIETAFLSCIGVLVIQTAVIGRTTLGSCLRIISIFSITWNLNYFLNIYLNYNNAPERSLIFDAFGASFLYLFAGAFGLFYAIVLPQKISSYHRYNQMNRTSLIFGLIGTGFITATFMFSCCHYLTYSNLNNNIAGLNIMFSIGASIVGTFFGSALGGKGSLGYKQVLVGCVSGGVIIASVAPIEDNIGIVMMIGFIGGTLSGIYMRTLHDYINRNYIYDSLGLFGPFLLNAFVGSFIVAPSILDRYLLDPSAGNFNVNFQNHNISQSTVGYQLVYVGISFAIGALSGLFTGLISRCDNSKFGLYSNALFFRQDFSLVKIPAKSVITESVQDLKADEDI